MWTSLGILTGVTYSGFLLACRIIAGRRMNRTLTQAEFARLCDNYDEDYYSNMEAGAKAPGRELLELAAREAGFTFEDCIQIPAHASVTKHDHALNVFKESLNDWREAAALDSALALQNIRKPKRVKTGGRTRKKSE